MKATATPISRRNLVGKIGMGATLVAAAATLPGKANAAITQSKVHYAMVIDTRKCTGCHACSVACKTEFEVPLGVHRSWVEYVEKGTYPDVSRSFLPAATNDRDRSV